MPDSNLQKKSLADALVGVVDDVRRSVHGALGTRSWKVAIVERTWSGGVRGEGAENRVLRWLDPVPKVERVSRDRMGPAGREASGSVVLTEVSLSYTEAELDPKPSRGGEVAYALVEAKGQQRKTRWFVIAAPPYARRGDNEDDNIDWYIVLNETSDMGDLDGVDA